jgi:hypothetical protein
MSDRTLNNSICINCISILDNKYYQQVNLIADQVDNLIHSIRPEHDIYK